MAVGPVIGVTFNAEGDNVVGAVRALSNQIQRLGQTSRRAGRGSAELGRSFRNIALRTVGIIATVRAFDLLATSIRQAVSAGIQYNEVIETSTLAIASLITAQAKLTDQTGRQLETVEALDAAVVIAEDQVRKLRIAGIQTAATTEELVDAFQQAVGAGIAAGLNLDEIRQVTIRIAQAAGALGVPYNQLNEEIRSILSGIIDQNTRIAKALGLTNEQLRQARESGRLAEFLLERFEAFDVAGDRIVNTFSALRSNLQEAAQLLAGDAFRPLFEILRAEGLSAVEQVFDFQTAQISPDLAGFVQASQAASAEIGEIIASAIRSGLEAFEDLSAFLEENEDEIQDIVDTTGDLVSAVGELSTEFAGIVTTVVRWGVETGAIEQTLETVSDLVQTIADNQGAVVTILVAATTGVAAVFTAVVGVPAAQFVAVAAAILGLAAGFDALTTSAQEAEEAQLRLREGQTRQQLASAQATLEATRLSAEYGRLSQALDDGSLSAEKAEQAQVRLREIQEELRDIAPELAAAIEEAGDGHRDVANAIQEEIDARQELLRIQAQQASIEQGQLQASLRAARARVEELKEAGGAIVQVGPFEFVDKGRDPVGVEEAEAKVQRLEDALEDAQDRTQGLVQALGSLSETLDIDIDPIADPSGEDSALKELRARSTIRIAQIKADLKETEALLKAALARNEISFREFFTAIEQARVNAANAQIAIQRELLGATEDPLQRAKIEADIIKLQSERTLASQEAAEGLREALADLENDIQKAQIRLLEATGQGAAAQRQKIEEEFEELTARLEAEGDEAGLALISRLFDVEIARARADEIERIIRDTEQRIRDRVEQIELLQQSGAITAAEARQQQAEAFREIRAEIARLLPELRAVAELTGNPEDIARVRQLENEFRRLTLQIQNLEDVFAELRRGAFDALQRSLEEFFTTGIEESESLADAFRRMALSIVESLQRVIAQMIALQIATAVFKALGINAPGLAAGGSADEAVEFAAGGPVRGPGGPTDDRILARLSAGEFVVRAAAVDRIGVDVLEQINRGIRPARRFDDLVPRFAEGGLVDPAARGSARAGRGGDSRILLEHSEDVVARVLESPVGERIQLRTIARNRTGIRRALGLG